VGHIVDFVKEKNIRRKNSHFPVNNQAANEQWVCVLKCMAEGHQVLLLRAVFSEEGCIPTLNFIQRKWNTC